MLKHIIILPDGTELRSGAGTKNTIMSVKVTESVNVGEELTMGSAFANILEATALTPAGGVNLTAGDEVTLYKVDDTGRRLKHGVYILEKPTRPKANTIQFTGYDRMIKLDKDLTEWLKSLTGWPYRLIDFAAMVCEACGLTLVTTSVPNEDFPAPQFVQTGVTGRQIMRWIGEICCRFCRANADGNIEFAWYEPSGKTITPSRDPRYFANSLTYDTYQTALVDAVQIRLADSDDGALWPPVIYGTMTNANYDNLNIRSGAGYNFQIVGRLPYGSRVKINEQITVDGEIWGRISEGWICITGHVTMDTIKANNPYVITGNAILLARVTEDLLPYLQVIENELAGMTYTPCKVSIPATLDIRAGNTVKITDTNGVSVTALVMTKTTTGRRDTLECTGSAYRGSSSNVNNKTAAETAAEMRAYADNVAKRAVANQTQEDIFNKLTDNGKIQGIYAQDGKWYINAEVAQIVNLIANTITAGRMSSKDKSAYFDLDEAKIVCEKDGSEVFLAENSLTLLQTEPFAKILGQLYGGETGGSLCLYDTKGESQVTLWPSVLFFANNLSRAEIGFLNSGRSFVYTDNLQITGFGNCHWEYIESIGKEVLVYGPDPRNE